MEHLNENGEMILITPREFIKATSSIKLNNFLYDNGTITDWYEYGDDIVFKGFNPNIAIWRYQINDFSRKTNTNDGIKDFKINDGQISFTSTKNTIKFNDLFFVKVGAVSGMDKVFTSENGNQEFVCSYTNKTGKLKRMIYDINHEDLYNFKNELISRKIKTFNEEN
jgi:adenine-specific DNA-methyltransferase